MNYASNTIVKRNEIRNTGDLRIRVQGKLDESWFDRLGNMAITPDSAADKPPVTILVGHLPDQAALSGVLNTLYEMHLPLLSVENLDEK